MKNNQNPENPNPEPDKNKDINPSNAEPVAKAFDSADFEPTWWEQIKEWFSLDLDTDDNNLAVQIQKNASLKGSTLWALVLACLIVSIGLNINSLAVIIGAMLISPLMGFIVGAGYAAGTNDTHLLKISLRNLGILVGLGLAAAFIYFLLSPLKEPSEEILARIRPTLYDVLVAIAGGFIGIIATARKEEMGLALSGVAIAAALVPAIGVAGYGLATFQLGYFLGAAYLFFINVVFIALAVFLFVKMLKIPAQQFADEAQAGRARLLIGGTVVVALIPSIFTAYQVVREAVFMQRANHFIRKELTFENTTLLKPYTLNYKSDTSEMELVLVGEALPEQVVESLKAKLKDPVYGLANVRLTLRQSNGVAHSTHVSAGLVEQVVREKDKTIEDQRKRISELETRLARSGGHKSSGNAYLGQADLMSLGKKLAALFPQIRKFGYNEILRMNVNGSTSEIVPTVILDAEGVLDEDTKLKIANYLKLEMQVPALDVVEY